jgi:membrane associated rhomboid family serine protease
VTLAVTLITAAIWLLTLPPRMHEALILWGAFVPAEVLHDFGAARAPLWLTPVTAAMLHADFVQLLLNLLLLAICGRPVENVLGPWSLGILLVAGAYAGAAAHYGVHPAELAPAIGANAAVSSVLGAYAMLFGRNKVKVSSAALGRALNALWLIAAWVALNLLWGLAEPRLDLAAAIAAPTSAFLVGLLFANPLLLFRYRKA